MVQVLKAFSMFKKRQQTVMKLVVANPSPKLEALLRSYKYRHDVVTDKPRSLRPQLIASAYAVICVGPWLQANVGMLQAIQAQKALICFPKADFEPLAGAAGRYPESLDAAVFAAALMQLYTNESALLALEQEAATIAKAYTWQNVAEAVLAALPPLV
jgi:glycosyltransferase involved in cell wall biosynthesis